VGKTPYEKKVPGGYFHKTATAFGKRLGTPLTATVSLDGYVTRTFELTTGPFPWIDLNGNSHGNFYMIKLDISDTPSLTFADMSLVRVGEDAIAIGNPALGMQNTVTRGIVSVGPEPEYGAGVFIQTDAAINPGNSGGHCLIGVVKSLE
jgi:hypothetical protein